MARGKRTRPRDDDDEAATPDPTPRKDEPPKSEEPRKRDDSHHRAEPPDSRQNADDKEDDDGRELLISRCRSVLQLLMDHKHAWLFNEPVDPVALEIPDYPSIIKHPMDLGTILGKLDRKNYSDLPLDFVHDVRLTFDNAMLYNPPGHDVHTSARKMLAFFEKEWNKSASRSMVMMSPRTPRQLSTPLMSPVKAFSFEEKQSLLEKLQNLPPDKQHAAVLMMREKSSHVDWSAEEVDVQLDLFDNHLLQELEEHVKSSMKISSSDSKARQASGSKSRGKGKQRKGKGKAEEDDEDIGFVIDVPISIFTPQKVK